MNTTSKFPSANFSAFTIVKTLLKVTTDLIETEERFMCTRSDINARVLLTEELAKNAEGLCMPTVQPISHRRMVKRISHRLLLHGINKTVLHLSEAEIALSHAQNIAKKAYDQLFSMGNKVKAGCDKSNGKIGSSGEEQREALLEVLNCALAHAKYQINAALVDFETHLTDQNCAASEQSRGVFAEMFLARIESARVQAESALGQCERMAANFALYAALSEKKEEFELGPLPELRVYPLSFFATRYHVGPSAIQGHLLKLTDKTKDGPHPEWAKKELLKPAGRWEIRNRSVAEKFDDFLKKNTDFGRKVEKRRLSRL